MTEIKIILDNLDIAHLVTANSIKWNRYDAFRSDFAFEMEVFEKSTLPEAVSGMQVRLFEANNLLWGGIISQTVFLYRSQNLSGISIRCTGYEQIPTRRSSNVINIGAENAGTVARYIFDTYLSENAVNGEGLNINADSFDSGGGIVRYTSAAARLNKVLDDIAGSSGFRWWITADKTFYFKAQIPVRQTSFTIDLTANENQALQLSFREKSSEYRNIQIVLGKDPIVGTARNEAEISRMQAIYGSGEYSNIVVNRNILTVEDADNTAQNILSTYNSQPLTAVFTTLVGGLNLFDRINIKAPRYSLFTDTSFVITEINAVYSGNGFLYTVTAKKSDLNFFRPSDSWTESFGQLISRADLSLQGSPSSGQGEYLKTENLLPGVNITLDKTGKNITINSTNSENTAIKRIKKADLRANGMQITLEDKKILTYTYTMSEEKITSLIDSDGFTTEIIWNNDL